MFDVVTYRRLSHSYETVVLFADVSGFTALSEMLSSKGGRDGAEQLAKHVRPVPLIDTCDIDDDNDCAD